jgi:hypothetical protein
MPERRTHDYARHGITSLFAAFNTADGTVIGELHRKKPASTDVRAVTQHSTRAWVLTQIADPPYGSSSADASSTWMMSSSRIS